MMRDFGKPALWHWMELRRKQREEMLNSGPYYFVEQKPWICDMH